MPPSRSRLRVLESPREWDALFERACLEYKATATSRLISVDSGRVWNYMKRQAWAKDISSFVESDEFNIISVKKRINDAIKRQSKAGIWQVVPETSRIGRDHWRTGGTLYMAANE